MAAIDVAVVSSFVDSPNLGMIACDFSHGMRIHRTTGHRSELSQIPRTQEVSGHHDGAEQAASSLRMSRVGANDLLSMTAALNGSEGYGEARAKRWRNVRVSKRFWRRRVEGDRRSRRRRRAEPEAEAVAPETAVEEVAAAPEASDAAPAVATPAADVPTPSTLGRPLTLKEKLAAARAGGAPQPAARAKPAKTAAPARAAAEAAAPKPRPKPRLRRNRRRRLPPPAKPLGRPMTLQEKLAAARGGGASRPRPRRGAGQARRRQARGAPPRPPGLRPSAAAAGEDHRSQRPRRGRPASRRQEGQGARRQGGRRGAPQSRRPSQRRPSPSTVLPGRRRELAAATAAATAAGTVDRRGFLVGACSSRLDRRRLVTFTAALGAMTLMSVRFMFPNVLAEPPSTIKVGLPSNLRARGSQRALQGRVGLLDRPVDALQRPGYHLRAPVGLHAPGLPAQLAGRRAEVQVPVPRQRLLHLGSQLRGPGARPLERFKVALADDGQIMVDKSQKFQQELGQWSDPDSFIPV